MATTPLLWASWAMATALASASTITTKRVFFTFVSSIWVLVIGLVEQIESCGTFTARYARQLFHQSSPEAEATNRLVDEESSPHPFLGSFSSRLRGSQTE